MQKTVLFGISTLLCLCQTVFSYNARVAGLGGNGIVSDITNIISLPGYVAEYPDQMQMTSSPDGFLSSFGIKSIGPYANVGYYFTKTGNLRSDYVYHSKQAIDRSAPIIQGFIEQDLISSLPAYSLPIEFPVMPHLLFGFNLGMVTLGADLFYYNYKDNTSGDTTYYTRTIANLTDTLYTSQNKTLAIERHIQNRGAKFGMNLKAGPLLFSPVFLVSYPNTAASLVSDSAFTDSTGSRRERTTETLNNPNYITAGGEIWLALRDWNFVLGGFFSSENHAIVSSRKVTNPGQDTIRQLLWDADYPQKFINGYLGFVRELPAALTVSSVYTFSYDDKDLREKSRIDFTIDQLPLQSRDELKITHSLLFSFEKTISNKWHFDAIIPRAGAEAALVNQTLNEIKPKKTGSVYFDQTWDNQVSPKFDYRLSTGLGLKKGIGQFDMLASFGNWNGLGGPLVMEASLSLNFGRLNAAAGKGE